MSFYFVVMFYPMFSLILFSYFWEGMGICLYVHLYLQDNGYLQVFADRSPVPKNMEIKYKWN